MTGSKEETPGSTPAIELQNVSFRYSDGTTAVDGASVTVSAGEFFGFLGPNGAGKTTAIKLLVTLLQPNSGQVTVNGYDVVDSPRRVRATVGYTAQETGVDPELTARENVAFACEMYHVPRRKRADRIDELLELVGLEGVADRRAESFSGGMRRRLDIATALVHDPPLLFLDEPTTGLDPRSRLRLWEHFREINDRGTTVFLTTQNMQEADELCDRIGVINEGTIIALGTPASLKEQLGTDSIRITLASRQEVERAKTLLEATDDIAHRVDAVDTDHDSIVLTTRSAEELATAILATLFESGIELRGFEIRNPTLDDAFLHITGERFEAEPAIDDRQREVNR